MPTGELQEGRYQPLRLLGKGGMGEVYLMQDTRVNRQVAIKVIRAEGVTYANSGSDSALLFQREARAIAALEHPNILPLYDFGEENHDGIAITYMVMPYCADGSLEGWLRKPAGRIIPTRYAAYLIEQAAEALQWAHDHKVIHLDVKLSNFLLRHNKRHPERPTLLLADFGIARNFMTITSASHTIRGTPTAMAPEQWSSSPVFATDQYSLAVMAYEMIAGRPPFVGSMEQLMYQHFTVQPPAPSTFNPKLPPEIDAVILRALAKKADERYPSISEFATALVEAAQEFTVDEPLEQETEARQVVATYATLAISQSEANAGVSRMVTLPSGIQVAVPIPAGVHNGQLIPLPNPNADSESDSEQATVVKSGEALLLEIAIKSANTPALPITNAPSVAAAPKTPNLVLSPPPAPVSDAVLPAPVVLAAAHDLPTMASASAAPVVAPPVKRASALRFRNLALISGLVIILLLSGTTYLIVNNLRSNHPVNANALNSNGTPTVAAKPSPTAAGTPSPTPILQAGLYIAGSYNGSMHNDATGQNTPITIRFQQRQGNAGLKGTLTLRSATQGVYQLSGIDDQQGNFSFTVQQPTGQTPLFFQGNVQQEILHGYFCSSATNSCSTQANYFTAGPRY